MSSQKLGPVSNKLNVIMSLIGIQKDLTTNHGGNFGPKSMQTLPDGGEVSHVHIRRTWIIIGIKTQSPFKRNSFLSSMKGRFNNSKAIVIQTGDCGSKDHLGLLPVSKSHGSDCKEILAFLGVVDNTIQLPSKILFKGTEGKSPRIFIALKNGICG